MLWDRQRKLLFPTSNGEMSKINSSPNIVVYCTLQIYVSKYHSFVSFRFILFHCLFSRVFLLYTAMPHCLSIYIECLGYGIYLQQDFQVVFSYSNLCHRVDNLQQFFLKICYSEVGLRRMVRSFEASFGFVTFGYYFNSSKLRYHGN